MEHKNNSKPDVSAHHGKCEWVYAGGSKCTREGTVSPSTVEGQVYCLLHYDCLTKGLVDDVQSAKYAKWHKQNKDHHQKYCRKTLDPDATVYWDPNDASMVKGLAWLGEDSILWKKSPEALCRAARKLIESGWKPRSELPTKTLDIESINENQLW